jgi:hypothetical protein
MNWNKKLSLVTSTTRNYKSFKNKIQKKAVSTKRTQPVLKQCNIRKDHSKRRKNRQIKIFTYTEYSKNANSRITLFSDNESIEVVTE